MAISYDWTVQNLRITLFPEKGYTENPINLWPKTKSFDLQKQTSNPKTGGNVLEGKFDNKETINLVVFPLRIEMNLLPDIPNMLDFKFPTLGVLEDTLERAEKIWKTWLTNSHIPELTRVAVGLNLLLKVSSTKEGYKLLVSYLPFKIDFKKYKDFNFQVNNPTTSRVIKNLTINRLIGINVLRVKAEVSKIGFPNKTHEYPEQYYLHLELDINTDQEFTGTFKMSLLPKILEELLYISKAAARERI